MVFRFLFEDCEVCLIIQAQATTLQLYKTFLELKVLCASRSQYLFKHLHLILNWISSTFQCKLKLLLEKWSSDYA